MNRRPRTASLLALLALVGCNAPPPEPSSEETAAVAPPTSFRGHDGARLWMRVVPGPGDPVVVVHGGPGCDSAYLEPDLEPLSRWRTVVFYDQRGSGRSELVAEPERLGMPDHVADLEALRQELGLERLTLVAHSFGPLVAASYAVAHPERVERMVFLGPVPPMLGDLWERIGVATEARLNLEQQAEMERAWEALEQGDDVTAACRAYWAIGMIPRLADPSMVSKVKGDLCAASPEAIRHGLVVTNAATLESAGDWDLRAELAAVTAPTLILHGEAETIPIDMVAEWVTALPSARLVPVPGAAHFPYVEQPELVWKEIEAFLAEERTTDG